MSVIPTTAHTAATGNGATTAFPFGFACQNVAELQVFLGGTLQTSGYTVTLAADFNSGTVTFATPPANGTAVLIASDPSFEQTTQFQNAGAFLPQATDLALDKAAIRDIYLNEALSRSLQAPVGESPADLPSAAERAGGFLSFDALGDPIASSGSGADAALRTDLAASTGSNLIGWISSFTGAVVRRIGDLFLDKITPADFGAVGDGVTDDYAALKAFVTALSNSTGLRASLEGKTYWVGQHHTATNGVTDLIIQSAVGLKFYGGGATVNFDGSFDRALPLVGGVCPIAGIGFAFNDCHQLHVADLTLNGNVQNTTNSSGSVESSFSTGIQINGCTDVKVDNVEPHHFATDGFIVQGSSIYTTPHIASKRVKVTNLNSHNNGRCNVSVFEAEQVVFQTFLSTDAGNTQVNGVGSYPGHSPFCGLDIEPNYSADNGTADIDTNNIHFEDGKFLRNKASDINGVLASLSDISFMRVHVESQDSTGSAASINIGCPRTTFRDCYLNLGTRQLLLGGNPADTFDFENNDIIGSAYRGNALVSNSTVGTTMFTRNRLTCTATVAKLFPFIACNNTEAVFEANRLFIPAAYYLNESGGGCKVFDVIMRRSVRNVYATDMNVAGQYFYTKWNTTPVFDESYEGQIRGAADTFRPALSSTFDTTKRFTSQGFLSTSPTLGVGYAAGAGTSVVQTTNRNTNPPAANTRSFKLTLVSATTTAGERDQFTVACSPLGANDTIDITQLTGTGFYIVTATNNGNGTMTIQVYTPIAVSVAEAPAFQFNVWAGTAVAA